MATPFDRDFGYLVPFLDKLEAHARGLGDAAARDELLRLLDGEKARFGRIHALLGGAPSSSPAAATQETPAEAPTRPTLTVGNLTKRSRGA